MGSQPLPVARLTDKRWRHQSRTYISALHKPSQPRPVIHPPIRRPSIHACMPTFLAVAVSLALGREGVGKEIVTPTAPASSAPATDRPSPPARHEAGVVLAQVTAAVAGGMHK